MEKWIDLALNSDDKNTTLFVLAHKAFGNCRLSHEIAVKYSDYNSWEKLSEYAMMQLKD